jgi:hypothetical protein
MSSLEGSSEHYSQELGRAPDTDATMRRRRHSVATAPYVTDTHYKTPPPRSDLEAALRIALVRKEWLRVNELLGQLRSAAVPICGGVLDVAMRTLLRINGEMVPLDDTMATSSAPSSLVREGSPTSSDNSDDERQLVPKNGSSSASSPSRLHYSMHSQPAGRAPSTAHTQMTLSRRASAGGLILVPASSLPPASIPTILQDSGGGDWGNTFGSPMPTAKPIANKSKSVKFNPYTKMPFSNQQIPYMQVNRGDGDTSTDGNSSTTPMSTPGGPHHVMMSGSAPGSATLSVRNGASPAGSLASTPHLSLAGFLADDHPTAHALITRLLEYPHYETSYCGPVAVAVELGDVGCVRVLLRDRRFDPNTGCPVRMAVCMNRIECMDLLLSHPRINPNRGAPLYNAVVQQKLWAVKALLDHPHTQVNRYATGASTTPLLAAIRGCSGSSAIASQPGSNSLLNGSGVGVNLGGTAPPAAADHQDDVIVVAPTTTLSNRHNSSFLRPNASMSQQDVAMGELPNSSLCGLTSRQGGTNTSTGAGGSTSAGGLRSGISNNSGEDIARCVVQCSRVDINKGFAISPLQLAVSLGELEIARWILTKPNAAPNRAIGVWPTPLEIALEQSDAEMTHILLSDPRVYVTEEMVNQLEATNNLPILQLIASLSQDVRIGYVWSMRCLAVVAAAIALWASALCEVVFIAAASHMDVRSYSFWIVGLNVLSCVVAAASLLKRKRQNDGMTNTVSWYLAVIPFAPIPESVMAAHIVRWLFSDTHDLYFRQKLFEVCYLLALVRGVCVLFPQCVVLSVAFAHAPTKLHSYAAATLFFNILALFVCCALRFLRIPRSPTAIATEGGQFGTGIVQPQHRRYRHVSPLIPSNGTMPREIAV